MHCQDLGVESNYGVFFYTGAVTAFGVDSSLTERNLLLIRGDIRSSLDIHTTQTIAAQCAMIVLRNEHIEKNKGNGSKMKTNRHRNSARSRETRQTIYVAGLAEDFGGNLRGGKDFWRDFARRGRRNATTPQRVGALKTGMNAAVVSGPAAAPNRRKTPKPSNARKTTRPQWNPEEHTRCPRKTGDNPRCGSQCGAVRQSRAAARKGAQTLRARYGNNRIDKRYLAGRGCAGDGVAGGRGVPAPKAAKEPM